MEMITNNYEWIFSGIGVAIIGLIIKLLVGKRKSNEKNKTSNKISNNNTQTTTINVNPNENLMSGNSEFNLQDLKNKTHILFIDDDERFKVVDILKKNDWLHTSSVTDIKNLDSGLVQSTHIFFIDILGVGKELEFRDEGLGLVESIKDKYPEKKVVIYSAQSEGERFHKAFRIADDFLSKDAEPYEFQSLTESLSANYWKIKK